ncbi:LysE family translocator [Vibrio neptunius]|uniref:LysE family translocator n=1 Tax=Vibrio neptunius TaxID=170651 RepID=A0ABS3A2E7_9VIBR|nr:LysE family translocator [Vibrio neptunius]MBN3493692.1 LysE family translocator [Vibrio neptunius]MBN3516077.1 LysE family translocator [Vibrio neptunius]MBN3550459.1 LysE family translocator [Vibrio neptunius]MBN3578493.1 LysE family translocator [Vibrio neptunius]MCH9872157.1 LysE family translocator [Vibrio neptunius]
MISTTELFTYLFVTLLYAFMPGPAMLYSIAQAVSGGKKVGIMAVFGLHVGGYFHVLLAVLGLSSVLLANPSLYSAIQKLGALYLVWLGFQRIYLTKKIHITSCESHLTSPKRTFFDSVVVDVLNPKAAIFYLAFLPQFVNEAGSVAVWLQLLILGVVTNLMFSSADLLSVLMASHLQRKFQARSNWVDFVSRWSGSIFILLGVMALVNSSQN